MFDAKLFEGYGNKLVRFNYYLSKELQDRKENSYIVTITGLFCCKVHPSNLKEDKNFLQFGIRLDHIDPEMSKELGFPIRNVICSEDLLKVSFNRHTVPSYSKEVHTQPFQPWEEDRYKQLAVKVVDYLLNDKLPE